MLHWLARACIGLYPRAWRERYGEELAELLGEDDGGMADVVDVLRSALRERRDHVHRRLNGGSVMVIGPARRHPTALALLAAALMAPTFAFVVASLVGHELGLTPVADAVDPVITSLTSSRLVDLALVGAPLVALVLAVAPLLELGLRRGADEPVATVAIRLRAANVAVAMVSVALGLVLVAYAVTESMAHAGR